MSSTLRSPLRSRLRPSLSSLRRSLRRSLSTVVGTAANSPLHSPLTDAAPSSLRSESTESSDSSQMKRAVAAAIPEKRAALQSLRRDHAAVPLDTLTVGSVLGGMRGARALFWGGTTLSPEQGIRFHGLSIEQCQAQLPGPEILGEGAGESSPGESADALSPSPQFLPESMLWLLMTGRPPSPAEALSVTRLLNERIESQGGALPPEVSRAMRALPRDLHPMTQLSVGLSVLQRNSQFARAYEQGKLGKADYWAPTYEDAITLIANLPLLAGEVYSTVQAQATGTTPQPLGQWRADRDWSYNLCSLLGYTADSANIRGLTAEQQRDFVALMRLYTGIHADHEGGNVSAHTTHLVGSALADPFLAYAAGANGLAGPLHGLAAQEVVRFLESLQRQLGGEKVTDSLLSDQLWALLRAGQVIPGYGHAVLRRADPRFTAMLRFAQARPAEFGADPHVQLMVRLSRVAPAVLREHGRCNNPHPNVDAASGILFHHYGVRELLFFTVIFACSRALGPLAQLVWDRAYGLPIERPKSVDLGQLMKLARG
ncbi:citrate (Si)-synthase [Maudiozyma humilis]|uniref:Citrate synthase n=1 Tax=Maudiozyma humilis TaxID=51915 RepID=A0AAV5RTS7_MAUHU|nr:citrate (Si)-synthase [Kazachstania humilis]